MSSLPLPLPLPLRLSLAGFGASSPDPLLGTPTLRVGFCLLFSFSPLRPQGRTPAATRGVLAASGPRPLSCPRPEGGRSPSHQTHQSHQPHPTHLLFSVPRCLCGCILLSTSRARKTAVIVFTPKPEFPHFPAQFHPSPHPPNATSARRASLSTHQHPHLCARP